MGNSASGDHCAKCVIERQGFMRHAFHIGDEDRLLGKSRSLIRSLMAGRNDVLALLYPTANAAEVLANDTGIYLDILPPIEIRSTTFK